MYIVRDPNRVIPSTMHLWRVMRESQGLQRPTFTGLEDEVFETFHALDVAVESARQELPENRFAVVRYEDMRADAMGVLTQLYQQLELDDIYPARAALTEHLNQVRQHQVNDYDVDDTLQARIDRECREFKTRYGYAEAFERV